MTRNAAQDIRSHTFTGSDSLFLDANVWLSVYGPQVSQRPASQAYSKAWRDIRMAGSNVYIDFLVLSEFINRFARIVMGQSAAGEKNFKRFRQSPRFGDVAKEIALNVKSILQRSNPLGITFDHVDMDALLLEFEAGQSDFNDEVFAAFCKEKGFTLVTHDGDFRGKGIPILTANQHLLQPGP